MACSIYGALGWNLCGSHSVWAGRVCGVRSVCRVYGALELDPCGVYSVSSIYGALGLNVSCGVYCVFIVNGVLGMDAC